MSDKSQPDAIAIGNTMLHQAIMDTLAEWQRITGGSWSLNATRPCNEGISEPDSTGRCWQRWKPADYATISITLSQMPKEPQ